MTDKRYNVLFLCTGNSARSILAEALLARWGKERFNVFSAGSHPKGAVNPGALALLNELGWPTGQLRSKSWDEFAAPGAPSMDFIITVCDQAAGEACPFWPGQPMTAHWGIPDPAAVVGSPEAVGKAFHDAFLTLEARIKLLVSLRPGSLDRLALKRRMDQIGRTSSERTPS